MLVIHSCTTNEGHACAGDTTGNVWWRVENGELPRNHAPKVVVLMIGANDLSGAYVNCGTWDEGDYTNAAASIAQQYAPLSDPSAHASRQSTHSVVRKVESCSDQFPPVGWRSSPEAFRPYPKP